MDLTCHDESSSDRVMGRRNKVSALWLVGRRREIDISNHHDRAKP